MYSKNRSIRLTTLLAVFAATLFVTSTRAASQQESVLFSFGSVSSTQGSSPQGGLVRDAAGNLYGTTFYGGTYYYGGYGCGTAFELSPAAGGGWTETVLHDFNCSGGDGYYPQSTLIIDAAGNLYGTTYNGGTNAGTVFKLSPTAGGNWTETILHSFDVTNSKDGAYPTAGLVSDVAGNLYGTTYGGGPYGYGTVFEVSPGANGHWSEKLIHAFNKNGRDGINPHVVLARDAAGNLYGATQDGGAYNYGVAFELSPSAGGGWTERLLHSFNNNGKDGWSPFSGLTLDAAGNLYGVTSEGGIQKWGTVYELTKTGANWSEKVLFSFNEGKGGSTPEAGLIFDSAGNLYGATSSGGPAGGGGVAFKLTPSTSGVWTETLLYSWGNNPLDDSPRNTLIMDEAGNLYGTTPGEIGFGAVFEITP